METWVEDEENFAQSSSFFEVSGIKGVRMEMSRIVQMDIALMRTNKRSGEK